MNVCLGLKAKPEQGLLEAGPSLATLATGNHTLPALHALLLLYFEQA
jgi:hypothetical protein